jgi:hypothetical protein
MRFAAFPGRRERAVLAWSMKRLSSVDSALWFTETKECPTHISALLICDPSEAPGFSFSAVKDLVAARIPEMPVLRWRGGPADTRRRR